jgi:hypothetical protein
VEIEWLAMAHELAELADDIPFDRLKRQIPALYWLLAVPEYAVAP